MSAVWSAKMAYVGSGKHARGSYKTREEATYASFSKYLRSMADAGAHSILVVSGAGPKKKLCSVVALQGVQMGRSEQPLLNSAHHVHASLRRHRRPLLEHVGVNGFRSHS